jgi:hypothetical protein
MKCTTQQFYKKHNRWTEGLIPAARSVAFAARLLIESADGVISGTHTWEQLIVVSNEVTVAAATAQHVAASLVKVNLMSKTQEKLELAARAVTEACKALVQHVKVATANQALAEEEDIGKRAELEQQAEILRLEDIGTARHKLGRMSRARYHQCEE